jgi:hypothetical protein
MFALIDTTPAHQPAPCKACSLLLEVGPPPMISRVRSQELVVPSAPCPHAKERNNLFPDLDQMLIKKSYS